PTLQLPTQGIGNWCYPYIKPIIDDSGLRKKTDKKNTIITPQNIPFTTPSNTNKNNIAFVSRWDNFPKSIEMPLSGKASHAFFMMAGTTNPMQSRFVNGVVEVTYADGTMDVLELKNPENWWPIEQDYFVDGLAFTTDAPKPPRVYLKSGVITRDFKDFEPIKGFTDFGINGGAATILDLPLNPNKTLKNIQLKAVANEVVIGLMSVTLVRN
ncbi:MAG TPA: glycogen debranching protein, partial [Mariniflexile sp.]